MKRRRSKRKYKLPAEVPDALSTALDQQLLEDFIRGRNDRQPPAENRIESLGPDSRGYSDFEALLRGEFDAAAQEAEVAKGPLPPKPELVWDRQTGHRKLQATNPNVQKQEQEGDTLSPTAPLDAPDTSAAAALIDAGRKLGPPGVPGQPGAQRKSLSQLVPGEFGPCCRRPVPPDMKAKPVQEFGQYSIDTFADHRRNAAQKIIEQCNVLHGMIAVASANAVSASKQNSTRLNKFSKAARNLIFEIRSSAMDNVARRTSSMDMSRFQLLKYSHAERQLKEEVAKEIKTAIKRLKKTQKDASFDLDRLQRRMHVQGRAAAALLQVSTGGHDSEFVDRMLGVQLRHRELAAMAALGSYALGRFKLFTNFKRNINVYKSEVDEAYVLREADAAQQNAAATEKEDKKMEGEGDKGEDRLELQKQTLKMKVMENKLQALREDEKQVSQKARRATDLELPENQLAPDEGEKHATDRTEDTIGENQGTDAASQNEDGKAQNIFEKIEKNRNTLKSDIEISSANRENLGRMLEFVENAQENMKQIMNDIGKVERRQQMVLEELQDEVDTHSAHHVQIMIQSLEIPWKLLDPEVLPPQRPNDGNDAAEQAETDNNDGHDDDREHTSPAGKALLVARKTIVNLATSDVTTPNDAASLDSDGHVRELVMMRKRHARMLALRNAMKHAKSSEPSPDQLHGHHAEATTPAAADMDSMSQLQTVATEVRMVFSDMKREFAEHEADVDQLDARHEAGKRLLEQTDDSIGRLMNILSQLRPSENPQADPAGEGDAIAKAMEQLTEDFTNLSRSMLDLGVPDQEEARQTRDMVAGEFPKDANQLDGNVDLHAEDPQALLDWLVAAKKKRQEEVEALRRELVELQAVEDDPDPSACASNVLQDVHSKGPTSRLGPESEASGTGAQQLDVSSDSKGGTIDSLMPEGEDGAKQDVLTMPTDRVRSAEDRVSENGEQAYNDQQGTDAVLQGQEGLEAELQEAARQERYLKDQISQLEAELKVLVGANTGSKLGSANAIAEDKQQAKSKERTEGRQQVDKIDIEESMQTEKSGESRQEGGRQQTGDKTEGERQTEGPTEGPTEGGLESREAVKTVGGARRWAFVKEKAGIDFDEQQREQPLHRQGNGLAFGSLSDPKAVHLAKIKLEREVKQLKQDYQKRTRLFLALLPKEKAQELMAAGFFSKESKKEETLDEEEEQVARLEHQLDSLKRSSVFWQNRLRNHIDAMQVEEATSPGIEEKVLSQGANTPEPEDANQVSFFKDVLSHYHQQSQHAESKHNTATSPLSIGQAKPRTSLAGMLASLAAANKPDSPLAALVIAGAANRIIAGARDTLGAADRSETHQSTAESASGTPSQQGSASTRMTALAKLRRGMHLMKFVSNGRQAVPPQEIRRFQLLLPVWRKAVISVRFAMAEVQWEVNTSKETHQEYASSIKQYTLEMQQKARLDSQTHDEQLSSILSFISDKRSRFLIVQHIKHLLEMPPYTQKPSMRCLALGHITNEDPLRQNARKDENDENKVDKDSMRCLAVASLLGQRLCSLMEKQWKNVESNKLLQMVADALEQDLKDHVQPEEDLKGAKQAEAFFRSVNMKARLTEAEARKSTASSQDFDVLEGVSSLQGQQLNTEVNRQMTSSSSPAMVKPKTSARQKGQLHKGAQSVAERKRRGSHVQHPANEAIDLSGAAVNSQRLPIIPPRRRKPSAELDGYSSSATSLGSSEEEDEDGTMQVENLRRNSGDVLSPSKNLIKSAAKEAKHAFARRSSAMIGTPSEQYWNDMRDQVSSRKAELFEEQMERHRAEQQSLEVQEEEKQKAEKAKRSSIGFSSHIQLRALQLRGDAGAGQTIGFNIDTPSEDSRGPSKDSPTRAKPPPVWYDRRTFLTKDRQDSPRLAGSRTMKSLYSGPFDQEDDEDDPEHRRAEVRRRFFLDDDDFTLPEAKIKGPADSPSEGEDGFDKSAKSAAFANASKRNLVGNEGDLHELAIAPVQSQARKRPVKHQAGSEVSVEERAKLIKGVELESPIGAEDPKFKRRISALHGVQRNPDGQGLFIQSILEEADRLEKQGGDSLPAGILGQALLNPTKQKSKRLRGRPMSAPTNRQQRDESPLKQDFVVTGGRSEIEQVKRHKQRRRQPWVRQELHVMGFQSSPAPRRRGHSPISLPAFSSDDDSSCDEEHYLKEILRIRQLLAGTGVPEPRWGESQPDATSAASTVATVTAARKFSLPEGWHLVPDGSASCNTTQMSKESSKRRRVLPLAEERGHEELQLLLCCLWLLLLLRVRELLARRALTVRPSAGAQDSGRRSSRLIRRTRQPWLNKQLLVQQSWRF
eukprot:TRINITY_DN18008_c0_g1_i1.p1 TRINITY_DN18008_c0_g1~~TRINITY_DN18008_c0_g1_i1.p1  ORF type:complete len:2318 (+),score=529.77 TRINITY_DN18008_c0_g1_i1:176-7129(+)